MHIFYLQVDKLWYIFTKEFLLFDIYIGLFLGGRRGTRTPKHFVNLTGESKNFKIFEFLLNQLQTYYG
jgi:hypothetical protein